MLIEVVPDHSFEGVVVGSVQNCMREIVPVSGRPGEECVGIGRGLGQKSLVG